MELTEEQIKRIEANRLQALAKRQQALQREQEQAKKLELENAIDLQDRKEQEENQGKPVTCECLDEAGEICGKTPVDEILHTVFDEQVCKACKKKTDVYDLIPKAECSSKYLIPEDAIKIMKFHNKDNPYNPGWVPMKLFLRKHALAFSIQRFGSEEALELERKKREEKKFERSLEKAENVLSSSAEEFRLELDSTTPSLSNSLEGGIVVRRSGGGISGIGSSSSVVEKVSSEVKNPVETTTTGKRKISAKQSAAAKKKKFLLDIAAVIRGES